MAEPIPVTELREVNHIEDVNGQSVTTVGTTEFDLCSPEAVETLQRQDEFNLVDQINAGVPLSNMTIGNLLTPTDSATLNEIGSRLGSAIIEAYNNSEK